MGFGGETQRIIDLPVKEYPDDAGWTEKLRLHPGAPPLLPIQEQALAACADAATTTFPQGDGPGFVGLISCGGGKTLLLQLIPRVFGVDPDDVILITEQNLVPQTQRAIAEWSIHYPLATPEILSFGKLSHPKHKDALEKRAPRLIMVDEAHKLGASSARYKRVFRYLAEHGECRFVAVTGTLMRRSVADMAHLMELALRRWSPVPRHPGTLDSWSSVIDVGGEPAVSDWNAVERIRDWVLGALPEKAAFIQRDKDRRTQARRGVQVRILTGPGVVASSEDLDELGVHLQIQNIEPVISAEVAEALELWELPDGTELVDSFEVHRHTMTLRCGFYYRYVPEEYVEEYVEARNAWSRWSRRLVEYGGYETRFFAEEAARAGTVPPHAASCWARWCHYRELFPPPETEAIWCDEGRLRELVDGFWDKGPGAVWARSRAIRERLGELYGADRVYAPGEDFPGPSVRRAVVPMSYHKGWEGQQFHRALLLQPPRVADAMEQVISRHHRRRQTEDVEIYIHQTEEEHWVMRAKALALQDTTANRQRYVFADYIG